MRCRPGIGRPDGGRFAQSVAVEVVTARAVAVDDYRGRGIGARQFTVYYAEQAEPLGVLLPPSFRRPCRYSRPSRSGRRSGPSKKNSSGWGSCPCRGTRYNLQLAQEALRSASAGGIALLTQALRLLLKLRLHLAALRWRLATATPASICRFLYAYFISIVFWVVSLSEGKRH